MVAARFSLPLLLISLLLHSTDVPARTWHIALDGSGDAPTIKAGIDSAVAGDTVLVACGTYYESGIEMKSGIVVTSESGQPDCVTIDANWLGRVFVCRNCDNTTAIKGLTITHGSPLPFPIGYGGGMWCESSDLYIADCLIVDNYADSGGGVVCLGGAPTFVSCTFSNNLAGEGGGVFCSVSSPLFTACVFHSDSAIFYGGGLWCEVESSPVLAGCTFCSNAGDHGGGAIHCFERSTPSLENTVIAFSTTGQAISREGGECYVTAVCCDIYGNAGGDWVDFVADQVGTDGNFSADPLFCDKASCNLSVEQCSPCLPANHPDGYDCGLIGALGQGCVCGAQTEPTRWGTIKARYR